MSEGPNDSPLAVRFGALGDMLMFLASIDAMARRWGRPVDVVTSGKWTSEILSHSANVGEVVLMPGTRRRPMWLSRSKQTLVQWLRDRDHQQILLFERNPKFDEFLQAAEIEPSRVARLPPYDDGARPHQVQEELNHAGGSFPGWVPTCSFGVDEFLPRLHLTDEDDAAVQRWLHEEGFQERPLVLIQPGNKKTMRKGLLGRKSNHKYWSAENWAAVIGAVRERLPDAVVLICGVPAEQHIALEIARSAQLPSQCAVADRLPLRRLFALQKVAHSMISVDTGPAHTAAAVDCPLVVLYGMTDPRRYHPLGRGPIRHLGAAGELADLNEWRPAPLEGLASKPVIAAWQGLRDQASNE